MRLYLTILLIISCGLLQAQKRDIIVSMDPARIVTFYADFNKAIDIDISASKYFAKHLGVRGGVGFGSYRNSGPMRGDLYDITCNGPYIKPGVMLCSNSRRFNLGINVGLGASMENGRFIIANNYWGDEIFTVNKLYFYSFTELYISQGIKLTPDLFLGLGLAVNIINTPYNDHELWPSYLPGLGDREASSNFSVSLNYFISHK